MDLGQSLPERGNPSLTSESIGVKEWVELISRTQKEYSLKDHEVRMKEIVLKGRVRKKFQLRRGTLNE
ncbi:hypothetical protein RUM44_002385 [Polyplax serrata]|uniref:LAGLIDADG homing endonuclease n=1 Tax=Polyplax serrata TaxID=468196 RepID=A0ABR1AFZ3_POLSC